MDAAKLKISTDFVSIARPLPPVRMATPDYPRRLGQGEPKLFERFGVNPAGNCARTEVGYSVALPH
jgi:hypothetical protein